MSELNKVLTLQDMAKRLDANGKIDAIVEILNQTNEILTDMSWIEGNLTTGHRTTTRAGLPAATWRLLNYGVQPTKSVTKQITDSCGMLEAYSETDKALADLNGNTDAFKLSEDRAFLEAMNQIMSSTLFYGNTSVNAERFVGIAPRFSSTSAESGENIISAGGTTNLTSIYLVCWGDQTAHGIFPKGSKAGFQMNDLGEQTLFDSNGGRYQGYRRHYKWDCGLTVRDWRYIVRIANIDTVALTSSGSGTDTSADLLIKMSLALDTLPSLGLGRPVFYMNNTVMKYLRVQLMNKSNVFLTMSDYLNTGKTLQFMGVPIRRVDQILNTESVVS